jgi:hypothetical protein
VLRQKYDADDSEGARKLQEAAGVRRRGNGKHFAPRMGAKLSASLFLTSMVSPVVGQETIKEEEPEKDKQRLHGQE